MHINERELEKLIIDSSIISPKEMRELREKALKRGTTLGKMAVSEGILSDHDLRRLEAYLLGLPFVDLKTVSVDFDVLSLIPEPVSRHHRIVAFKRHPDSLEVALLDTADLDAILFLKQKLGLKILPRLTDSDSIKTMLLTYQQALKEEFGDSINTHATKLKEGKGTDEKELRRLSVDPSAGHLVETLLKHALLQGASSVHIEPSETHVLIRYRIGGLLHEAMILPRHVGPALAARLKAVANLTVTEKERPQDGRFKINADGEKVSFRISFAPTTHGEKVVIRILREGLSGFTLESLGFHGAPLDELHRVLHTSHGLVLVAGPKGAGKTTMLYTMLDLVNSPATSISTIEDPIEFKLPHANQTQVRADLGLTFAAGIRSLLRQDADVLMVGDVNDIETATLTTTAALTEHLVFAGIQAPSATSAIARLHDLKVAPAQIASALKAVVALRLVRTLGNAKEKYVMKADELKSLGKLVSLDRILARLKNEKVVGAKATWAEVSFWRPKGEKAAGVYAGQTAITEVLTITPTIRELILKGATARALEIQGRQEGMVTMLEDGIFKAAQGHTTVEEVLHAISQ